MRVVDFAASTVDGVAPMAVLFTPTVSGDIVSYAWDFGDGATSTDAAPVHVYGSSGAYTVALSATFDDGAVGQATKEGYIRVASGKARLGLLYWIDESGRIRRGYRDALFEEAIVTGVTGARSLAVGGGKVYWLDSLNRRIERANLDGSGREVLVSDVYRPRDIVVDGRAGKIYWTTFPSDRYARPAYDGCLMQANLNGTGVTILIDFTFRDGNRVSSADGLAVDPYDHRLIWAYQYTGADSPEVYSGGELQSMLASATSPTSIRGDLVAVRDVTLEWIDNAPAQHIYYIDLDASDYAGYQIIRTNPTGGERRVILSGLADATSLAVDLVEGTLFWADKEGIHRAKLDGSEAELVYPGVAARSIALDL